MSDDYKMLPSRPPNQEEPTLVLGMIRVRNGQRKWIAKRGGGLREGDAVLA